MQSPRPQTTPFSLFSFFLADQREKRGAAVNLLSETEGIWGKSFPLVVSGWIEGGKGSPRQTLCVKPLPLYSSTSHRPRPPATLRRLLAP
jgi:hypothetical protein